MLKLITMDSFLTLSGLTIIVNSICNTMQRVFGFNPKWLALGLSIVLSVIAVIIPKTPFGWDYLFGFLNGFIVYTAAMGANEMANKALSGKKPLVDEGTAETRGNKEKRKYFDSWLDK